MAPFHFGVAYRYFAESVESRGIMEKNEKQCRRPNSDPGTADFLSDKICSLFSFPVDSSESNLEVGIKLKSILRDARDRIEDRTHPIVNHRLLLLRDLQGDPNLTVLGKDPGMGKIE